MKAEENEDNSQYAIHAIHKDVDVDDCPIASCKKVNRHANDAGDSCETVDLNSRNDQRPVHNQNNDSDDEGLTNEDRGSQRSTSPQTMSESYPPQLYPPVSILSRNISGPESRFESASPFHGGGLPARGERFNHQVASMLSGFSSKRGGGGGGPLVGGLPLMLSPPVLSPSHRQQHVVTPPRHLLSSAHKLFGMPYATYPTAPSLAEVCETVSRMRSSLAGHFDL